MHLSPVLSLPGWKNAILGLSCAPVLAWLGYRIFMSFLTEVLPMGIQGNLFPLPGVSTCSLKGWLALGTVQARSGEIKWEGSKFIAKTGTFGWWLSVGGGELTVFSRGEFFSSIFQWFWDLEPRFVFLRSIWHMNSASSSQQHFKFDPAGSPLIRQKGFKLQRLNPNAGVPVQHPTHKSLLCHLRTDDCLFLNN